MSIAGESPPPSDKRDGREAFSRLVVMVSGNGSTLQALIDAEPRLQEAGPPAASMKEA